MRRRGGWGHGATRNQMANAAGPECGCLCVYRAPDAWQGIRNRAVLKPETSFQVEEVK